MLPAINRRRGRHALAFLRLAFWDICRDEGVTAFNFMGALLMMLHKQPERPTTRTTRSRRAYGAPAPVTIYDAFEERFGVRLIEVYGSTEAGTATLTPSTTSGRSCGRAGADWEVEIHDEHDDVPPGVEGEIVVRPREPHVMFQDTTGCPRRRSTPSATSGSTPATARRLDEDGYFYFVDRMKDAIRRRGENISSWEVEKVLTPTRPCWRRR